MIRIQRGPNKKPAQLIWYEFTQNNSGGKWHCNDKVCQRVFIEAIDEDEAMHKAERLGLYFDGFGDCSCCGNRWESPIKVEQFPLKYSKDIVFASIEDYAQYLVNEYQQWTSPEARLFFHDGTIKEIFSDKK